MAPFSWIFFDLFDTLCTVDETVYYAGKRAAAEAAGVDPEAFLGAWASTSAEASIGRIKTPFDRAAKALAKLGVFDRTAVGEVARRDVETILASVVYYEGAPECLAALRSRGFRLGLISNATATTAFVVGPLKLRERLDLLVFSYEAGVVKPDPAIFRKALERSGADASRSLFVGDGANHELDAARALGWSTLCMDHPRKALSFRDPDGLSGPDHPRVTSFPDLLAWIGDAPAG
ncbi:MAG: HAD family hydrolase [Acidobacteriota bacterium]